MIRVRLLDSVYLIEHPGTGLAFSLRGARPRLKPRATASWFPTHRAATEAAAQHLQGTTFEIVRVDA